MISDLHMHKESPQQTISGFNTTCLYALKEKSQIMKYLDLFLLMGAEKNIKGGWGE